jgi:hypothetical protein
MITPYEKIKYMNEGMTVILRRIDPKATPRHNMICQVFHRDIYAAREDAKNGTNDCMYLALDLFTEREIETIRGSKTVAVEA